MEALLAGAGEFFIFSFGFSRGGTVVAVRFFTVWRSAVFFTSSCTRSSAVFKGTGCPTHLVYLACYLPTCWHNERARALGVEGPGHDPEEDRRGSCWPRARWARLAQGLLLRP